MTRMCFEPHGMYIVIQNVTIYSLRNGRTLTVRDTRIYAVPCRTSKLVHKKPKNLKKKNGRYLHPLGPSSENPRISIFFSNLFRGPSITFTYVYIITENSVHT